MTASLKLHCTVLRCVRQANPTEDHRRQRTFAWAVAAVILTGSASLGQWIGAVVTKAQAASTWRRLWRLMNNTLLDVASYYEPYIRAAVKGWSGRHALVAIDTTSMQDRRIVFRAALIYRGRAVPLAWKAVSTRSHSLPFEVYEPLLDQARALLPSDCAVTLLGGRGFGNVRLMVWCRRCGWHFALRLKGNRTVVLDDGHRNRLAAFAVGPMDLRLLEGVRLVGAKRHGLGAVNIAITRSPQQGSEPWFIVSDRSDTLGILADYRCRMNIEHGFKDDKSGALGWEACRMDTVEQVDRHLLVMAVAVLYLVSEGTLLVSSGDLASVDPHHKRGLSYFKLGLRKIQRALFQRLPVQPRLFLDPAHDPFPVCPYGIPFPISGLFTWLPGPARPAGT